MYVSNYRALLQYHVTNFATRHYYSVMFGGRETSKYLIFCCDNLLFAKNITWHCHMELRKYPIIGGYELTVLKS